VVLSRHEILRLLNATTSLKHQAALSVAYGAHLRVAEVAALKVAIGGERQRPGEAGAGTGQRQAEGSDRAFGPLTSGPAPFCGLALTVPQPAPVARALSSWRVRILRPAPRPPVD
jgi:hypothetical protein